MNLAPSQLSLSWWPSSKNRCARGKAAGEHDHEGKRLVGDRFGVLARRVDERQAAGVHRLDVDVDRAAAGAADESELGRGIEHSIGDRGSLDHKSLDAGHVLAHLCRHTLVFLDPQLGRACWE